MINFLLYTVFFIALAVAALTAMVMLQDAHYDDWVRDFEEKGGIQWPCTVVDGTDIVSHTVMVERRSNRR